MHIYILDFNFSFFFILSNENQPKFQAFVLFFFQAFVLFHDKFLPKIFFVTNIDLKNKNDQNKLKCFIKGSKYTRILIGLINLNFRV